MNSSISDSDSSSENTFKKYSVVFFSIYAILFVILLPNLLFLRNTGEFLSIKKILSIQIRNDGMYGSALQDDFFKYKIGLYERIKPEIVAIGSSRVMQFGQEFFNKIFVTLGGTFNNLAEGEDSIDKMLSIHNPKVVIIGVDFWWFNRNWVEPGKNNSMASKNQRYSINKHLRPFTWLRQKKISYDQYKRFLNPFFPINRSVLLGVHAITLKNGFSTDGSRYYTGIIEGKTQSNDIEFKTAKYRIDDRSNIYVDGTVVNPEHWEAFKRILRRLDERNIYVILFTPPFAPEVAEKLEGVPLNGLINDLERNLKTLDYPYFNFTNGKTLGSGECEFLDGVHGGRVTYARILKRIAESEGEPFESILNIGFINDVIDKYEGKAMIPTHIIPEPKEVDFLNLGCKK